MYRFHPATSAGLLLAGLLAATGWGVAAATAAPSYIEGVRDSEDLVWLRGTDWVIASGRKMPGAAEPGHLFLINAATGQAEAIYPPAAAGAAADASATCPGAPDPVNFEAHGLGLSAGLDGHYRLYSVNHAFPTGGREAVEIFSVDASQGKPRITWTDCVPMPANTTPNDVVALPEGGFAVTNFADPADSDMLGKLERGEDTGYVLEWHVATGFSKVAGSDMSGANGIEIDVDGKYYFVSAWGSQELIRLRRGDGPVERQSAATGMLADNSAWTWDGRLIVAGQASSVGDLFTCLSSTADFCATPFTVLAFEPDTLAASILIDETRPVEFGGATSPRPVHDELWLGSFRGGRIARYSLD